MKTNFKKYVAFSSIALLLAACHSGEKNSTTVADSANQKQIAATDSANKKVIKQVDSTNKVVIKNADSANKARTELKADASKFLVKSYESGLYEIQLSRLAATNGLDAEVKSLAGSLVTAHTAINDKMYSIAVSANFILPTELNADHQKSLQDIAKLKGFDFDKKYISAIVSSHESETNSYKDAYKSLPPSDTKNLAGLTWSKLEDHLAKAKAIKARLK